MTPAFKQTNLVDAETIDVNGQKYRIGYDQHGYFTILPGEIDPESGEFWAYDAVADVSIPTSQLAPVIEKMEERR